MLDPKTLYLASVVMTAMMILLTFLTWRANKNTSGTLLYVFYPVVLLIAISSFAIHSHVNYLKSVPIGNMLLFVASIIHCLAIRQFLNVEKESFKLFLWVTTGLFFLLLYFSIVEPNLRSRIYITDLQHLAEACLLLYYFGYFARKKYPNGSFVYITILVIIFTVLASRSLLMGDVTHFTLFQESWFAITIFFSGVLAPVFYATGMALLCNEHREQNLNKLALKAQQDLELRGMFLSTISHEIRTPLNGILGSAQLILGRSKDTKNKAYCEAIVNSAESLNLLIDKVLEYASLEQSDEALYEEDVELKSWLHNLCLLLSPLAEQKKLNFELVYELPDQVCYYFDQQKLRQILVNLVGNAIKFTDKGQVKLKVEIVTDNQIEHTVRFSVIDSGPGIEPDDIERLTEPYVQSSAGRVKGGTGLGLAITSRLLNRLGSQLHILSELDQGSTFSFDIKLSIGELSLVEQRPHHQNYITGLNVLLVEDLDLNQKIAIEFMAADEHKVKLAKDGKSAIDMLINHHFDVVLLDMNLPDLTGQEVLKALQTIEHKNSRTPFLAFTASLSPDEVKEYLALGIRDIVGKPIKQEKLRQALSESQMVKQAPSTTELPDTLYDTTAINALKVSFNEDELSSIYNEFVLSARNKLINIQQQLDHDNDQCIRQLHRQASTALQLGFNRYGLHLKKTERRLLGDKPCHDELTEAMSLWQQSLSAYLDYVRNESLS
ncbi:ATP-binding protein [Pseudoalteromonas sp. T1lg65]|uniref:ATP-binding protein n=1 Tax=Pseudoalteromonas sp. T1lg65 TaxID=2077101 RepID=UPI003F7936EB